MVAEIKADSALLIIEGYNIKDLLSVSFAGEMAGYDLLLGSGVTIKFVMKSMDDCGQPFLGDFATIVSIVPMKK